MVTVLQDELTRRKIDWPVGMGVNSLDLVEFIPPARLGSDGPLPCPEKNLTRT